MRKNLKNKKWYSIIVIIVIIWFLTVLTTGIFNLIMNELKDNRTIWSYVKAYAGAESAQELALFEIKEKDYTSDKEIKDPVNISDLEEKDKNLKDVFISYTRDLKTKKFEGKLSSWDFVLVPLFYLDSSGNYAEKKIQNINISPESEDISWNIIWKEKWISWTGENFNRWIVKTLENNKFSLEENVSVNTFLRGSEKNYLQIFNWWEKEFSYKLSSSSDFSKPVSKIVSSWESGNYRTNIETEIDFSKKNTITKYSIYSP